MGLYFDVFERNITTDQAECFAAALLEHFPKGIILVWDRWSVHRSAARRLARHFPRRLHIEWLPPYASDFQHGEQVCNQSKDASLANFILENIEHLPVSPRKSLWQTRSQQTLLSSFFKHAELPL